MRNSNQAIPDRGAYRWGRLGAVWLAAWFFVYPFSGSPAAAQIFTVTGVGVSARAASAAEAKKQAIAQGQLEAYNRLISKLTRPREAELLPAPDENSLQGLISGFSLDNERTGPTQYLADLTVRFNPDAVELLLARAGISLNVTQSAPVLIVPVVAGQGPDGQGPDGQARVWGAQNTWWPVWKSLGLNDRLVPVLMPLGDATDKQIGAGDLVGADADALSRLAARYGVDGAMVAVLSLDRAQGLARGTLNGLGPGGAEISIDRQRDMAPGDEQKAAREIVLDLLDGLDAQWRVISQDANPEGEIQKISLYVPFANLRDWVAIRGRLEVTDAVRAIDVDSLAAGGASIQLSYSGAFENFLSALDVQGLAIYDTGSRWELRAR